MSVFISKAPQNDGTFLNARNQTGGTLTKGTLLYISGYDTATARFLIAAATSTDSSKTAQYVSDVDISNNTNATVYPSRLVAGLDTSSASVEGDSVFLGVAGAFVIGGTSGQKVGIVVRKHATLGEIRFILASGGSPSTDEALAYAMIMGGEKTPQVVFQAQTKRWRLMLGC